MKIILVKQLNGDFRPAYESDRLNAKKIKQGELREFETKKPRNLKFHRKMFALFNMVFENQEGFTNLDHLRKYLTMKAGFYEVIETPTGTIYEAKSLSFAKMSEEEFEDLYERMLDTVTKIYTGLDRDDLVDNLIEFY